MSEKSPPERARDILARAHELQRPAHDRHYRGAPGCCGERVQPRKAELQIAIDGQPLECCCRSSRAASVDRMPIGATSRRSTSRATSSISTPHFRSR